MRINETVVGDRSFGSTMRRSSSTRDELSASIRLLRGQSYRTGFPGLFHPSTYLRSRARRSARLDATWGLSIRPAPKRSIRCCRYWELEIHFRKRWLTYGYRGRSFSDIEARCVIDDTSFIFRMSDGGRDNKICSNIS